MDQNEIKISSFEIKFSSEPVDQIANHNVWITSAGKKLLIS